MPIAKVPTKVRKERRTQHCYAEEFIQLPCFLDKEEPCAITNEEPPKLEAKTTAATKDDETNFQTRLPIEEIKNLQESTDLKEIYQYAAGFSGHSLK